MHHSFTLKFLFGLMLAGAFFGACAQQQQVVDQQQIAFGLSGDGAQAANAGAFDGVRPAAMPRIIGQGAAAGGPVNGYDADTRGGMQRPNRLLREAKPLPPNEFQKFVRESTGKLLPLFGSDFFSSPGRYEPQQAAPVSNDYLLGPGDEVLIRGWGAVDIDVRAIIDRNGTVNLPKVGAISLAGVRAGSAEEVIRSEVSKYFRGFNLNVTFGQLRGITVYLVGQARQPGTYAVSSVSTLVTALFATGGPNANGSLRRIQVKRGGKQISELDLYSFLAKGEKGGDIKLIDGDVIVIPPALGYVAVTGKVESPSIYELKGQGETVKDLLELVGGLPVLADPRRAFLERLDPSRQLPRTVEEFALDEAGLGKVLKSGDLISVLPITPEFANAITLRGSVNQPLRVPFREGMRVTDLVPSKEFLISRAAVGRQNLALQQDPTSFDLKPGSYGKAPEYESLQMGRQDDGRGLGDVRGGSQSFVERIGNQYDDLNWDYALIERLNRNDLTSRLIPFNLGKALSDPRSSDNVPLQPGDTVTVLSANDVRIPISKRKVIVRVEGEVNRPGVYQVAAGESLVNVIERAGGVTPDAFLFGSEFYRESVRKSQQENLDKFIRRLEQQSLSESSRQAANASVNDVAAAQTIQARLAADAESRRQFMQRLRDLKSSGRITLGLAPKESNFAALPTFRLENGDRLIIPNRPDFVQVFGAVNTESALLWQPGKTVSDYLSLAGLYRDSDKDGTFVIRTDGTIVSNTDRWFSSIGGVEVFAGDIIVTPEKLDKESAWTTFTKNAKDITQIFYQLGLGAAAIKTLRN